MRNFVRPIVLVAAFATLAGVTSQAQAQRRPDSLTMSCAAAKSIVDRAGAVVMQSGPNIYDRYVSHGGHCTLSEETIPAFIPSADNRACFVGYTCREKEDVSDP